MARRQSGEQGGVDGCDVIWRVGEARAGCEAGVERRLDDENGAGVDCCGEGRESRTMDGWK
jgi:hypothetical protein